MFTILGADGKEYGPVTAAKITEWIAGGRANLQTQARRAGETEWRTLADFVEFNPAATPPPLPAAVPVPAQAAAAPQIVPDEELADRGVDGRRRASKLRARQRPKPRGRAAGLRRRRGRGAHRRARRERGDLVGLLLRRLGTGPHLDRARQGSPDLANAPFG